MFRATASSVQSSLQARTLASTTAKALQDLKRRYDLLLRVEDGVWSGMSANTSTVAALVQLDSDDEGNSGAAVQMALAVGVRSRYLLTSRRGVLCCVQWLPGSFPRLGIRA